MFSIVLYCYLYYSIQTKEQIAPWNLLQSVLLEHVSYPADILKLRLSLNVFVRFYFLISLLQFAFRLY